jgi:threonine aldolase
MKGFGSDNHSGVHPHIFKSLAEANLEHTPSYGTDNYSEQAIAKFKEHFGPQTEVFFVFNGTASNVLSLRFLAERHESILCSDISHMNLDECGAPELFAGKLISLKSENGKLTLQTLKEALVRRGDQHYSQARVISLTQPTELGTCYSLNEIKEICDWAHANQMHVHIDGARLTNAIVHLKCTFNEMTTQLGVDVVSFGGTKNGLMMGEAILVLNKNLAQASKQKLKYIRKQSAQLPSKTRFIACQFSSYLSHNLFLEIAQHSCQLAQELYEKLQKIPAIKITVPRESNAVFAIIPKEWIKPLKEKFFFYVWDEKTFECRLMLSWDSKSSEVQQFAELAKKLETNSV